MMIIVRDETAEVHATLPGTGMMMMTITKTSMMMMMIIVRDETAEVQHCLAIGMPMSRLHLNSSRLQTFSEQ